MNHKLLEFIYPQRVFGKEITRYIKQKLPETGLIIDCPCGNGETTFHISKIDGVKVLGSDLSSECIEKAKRNYKKQNISFVCADIKECIQSIDEECVFCFINSLFLFNNATEILNLLQQKLIITNSQLLLIIPNTIGKNFLWFQKKYPNENKLIINSGGLKVFFEKMNFKVNIITPICYTHHFNRKDTKFLSVFWGIYLNILNTIQTALKIGKPNYFFIALSA